MSRIGDTYGQVAGRLTAPVRRRRLAAEERHFAQLEALVGLYQTLDIELPLPPMHGYPVTPDFARELATQVLARRPGCVLELGSGVSTLVAAYALRKTGVGRVLSLDHDAEWAARTRELLRLHHLEDLGVVVHAPLVPVTIGDETWRWYDAASLEDVRSVDLLIIDGPPGDVPYARYPAVPVLGERLAPGAAVLLDDAGRLDEQRIVERWRRECGPFTVEWPPAEKGLAVLTRVPGG